VEAQYPDTMTLYAGRPGFEGANIHTWIGFKHFMYQLEEAALEHCRQRGLSPQQLFQDYGLCLETVGARVRLMHTLHMDDRVEIEVRPDPRLTAVLGLVVDMFVERGLDRQKALTGKVQLLLRTDSGEATPANCPSDLAALTYPAINRMTTQAPPPIALPPGSSATAAEQLLPDLLRAAHGNAFVWAFRIPYFYCHYTRRLHYSGYVRLMEEVVDRFLADRGISIRTMLDQRNWIPVVSDARIEILREALMEETVYTVFTLEDIVKAISYTARVDWYVFRAGQLLRTATGRISHGYVGIKGRSGGQLVTFDEATIAALRGVTV
jgi:acyl-CoA thioesterase FadM